MRLGIAIDSRLCMSCYCCYMACKDEHCGYASALSAPQPMMGHFWLDIREWERGDSSRKIKTATVPTPCSHCQEPACMAAAANGAVYKRPDGIVIIDPVKSKGQKAIVDACPIGAVYWNEELAIPQKCTMCAELLDASGYLTHLGDPQLKVPRCVEACPNNALIFGDLDDPESAIARVIAENRITQLEPLAGRATNVVHLNIPTVFLAGTVYYPRELEEVCSGARVQVTCSETGETRETETNYFGDWEIEWLPKHKQVAIRITLAGYKPVTYTAFTDADHYVGMTYLAKE
ncbi:4Fe-4S dicluster domain-containing protein [Sporomusa termitida]|uniref:Pyrogallol hydroxytransferase small subunit n=1 Tax=Sporomusa termitida TaxID=2377 RepID=A0A517DV09_9FIRM|nr:4Fe-4S dicluster domain-containing protein [Sporomusa termitida]QDR81190.1 Pyrogallol hydroxytransferase small subunit [Sporomusa termitida]